MGDESASEQREAHRSGERQEHPRPGARLEAGDLGLRVQNVGITSRVDAASRSAGTVRVVISRLTEARRPTARRLRTPTIASTTTTTADVRKIFEASRISFLGLSPLARACLCRLRRRSQPG